MILTAKQTESIAIKLWKEIVERKTKIMEEELANDDIAPLMEKLDKEYESMSDEMKKFLWRYGNTLEKPSSFHNYREKACFVLWRKLVNPYFYDRETLMNEISFFSIEANNTEELMSLLEETIEIHVKEKKYNKSLHEMLS